MPYLSNRELHNKNRLHKITSCSNKNVTYTAYSSYIPAFVTTNHIPVIMGETTNTSGDIWPITSIFWCADGCSTGSLIKVRSSKYVHFILNKNRRWRCRRRWWRTSTIVVVLLKFQQNVKMLSILLIKSQFPISNLDLKKSVPVCIMVWIQKHESVQRCWVQKFVHAEVCVGGHSGTHISGN